MASKNVTLAMPEDLLAEMKIVAFQEGDSVNAIIRKLCEGYVGKARRKDNAREALLKLIDTSKGRMGKGRYSREDTYSGDPRFDSFKSTSS